MATSKIPKNKAGEGPRPKGGEDADRGSAQDAFMGDIRTAATSTMEPADYSLGYPPNEGVLRNKNFTGGKG